MGDVEAWSKAKNILCIRLDSLGDVLMMTPAIRALKETNPERTITLLTSRAAAKISPLIPEIDTTIVYDPPWMKCSTAPVDSSSEFEMIAQLKNRNFDAAVIFTTFSQSPLPAAFLTFMADIPLRLAHCRENPYYLLTDWIQETDHFGDPNIRHEVRRQLDLMSAVSSTTTNENLSLQISQKAIENVHSLLNQLCLHQDQPWIVLHPGATAVSRRYPVEHYVSVAHDLTSRHGLQVLFTGTESEHEIVEAIRSHINAPSFSLAGKLDVEQLAALISIAPLLVTNNTGPAHIAAAVNTPVVVLYALTNPQHTPWNVAQRVLSHDVSCKYCYKSVCPMEHHNCLELVSPEEVVQATLELLSLT